jgi:hypothetical protein
MPIYILLCTWYDADIVWRSFRNEEDALIGVEDLEKMAHVTNIRLVQSKLI